MTGTVRAGTVGDNALGLYGAITGVMKRARAWAELTTAQALVFSTAETTAVISLYGQTQPDIEAPPRSHQNRRYG